MHATNGLSAFIALLSLCGHHIMTGTADPSYRSPSDGPLLMALFGWAGIRGQVQIWPDREYAQQAAGDIHTPSTLSIAPPAQNYHEGSQRVRIRVSLEGGQPYETFYWGAHKYPLEFDGSTRLCDLPRLGRMITNFTATLGRISSEKAMYFSTSVHLWDHPLAIVGRALSIQSPDTGRVSCAALRLVHARGDQQSTFRATFRHNIGGTFYFRAFSTLDIANRFSVGVRSNAGLATTVFSDLYFINSTHGRQRLTWSLISAVAPNASRGIHSAEVLDDAEVFAEEISVCSQSRSRNSVVIASCRHRSCAVYSAGIRGQGRAYRVLSSGLLQVQPEQWSLFESPSGQQLPLSYVLLETMSNTPTGTQYTPIGCALLEEETPRLLRADLPPLGMVQILHESPFDPVLLTYNLTGGGGSANSLRASPKRIALLENAILNRRALQSDDRSCPNANDLRDEVFRPAEQSSFIIARSTSGTPDQHLAGDLGAKIDLERSGLTPRVGHLVDGSLSIYGVNSVAGRSITLFGVAANPSPTESRPPYTRAGASPRQRMTHEELNRNNSVEHLGRSQLNTHNRFYEQSFRKEIRDASQTSGNIKVPIPVACNNLDIYTDSILLKMQANFTSGDLRGHVLFSQLSSSPNSDTYIDVSICWFGETRSPSLTWALKDAQRHPASILNPWLIPNSAACSSRTPLRCAMGDLTGRFGPLPAPPVCQNRRNRPSGRKLVLRFTDTVLSLMGVTSIGDAHLTLSPVGHQRALVSVPIEVLD